MKGYSDFDTLKIAPLGTPCALTESDSGSATTSKAGTFTVTLCESQHEAAVASSADTARIVRRITSATAGFVNKMRYLLSPYRSGVIIAKTGHLVRSM